MVSDYHDRRLKREKRNPVFRFHFWRESRRLRKAFVPLSVREAGGLVERVWKDGLTYEDAREIVRLQHEHEKFRRLLERAYFTLKDDDERRKGFGWLLYNDIFEALDGKVMKFRAAADWELDRPR
jgi:hypothetical protein